MPERPIDILVLGGGIVGLSVAYALERRVVGLSIAVVDKESLLGEHQTGRNSGVIHSGVLYAPGSEKARFCDAGRRLLEAFCRRHRLPWQRTGKLFVVRNEEGKARAEALLEGGLAKGLSCRWVEAEELKELEPGVEGQGGVWVAETGIVDYGLVLKALAGEVKAKPIHKETRKRKGKKRSDASTCRAKSQEIAAARSAAG